MPWNEPGNNNDKDPWGGSSKRDDKSKKPSNTDNVEELTRKINEKVSNIFGGKSGGSGDGSNKDGFNGGGVNKIGAILVAVVAFGFWLFTGFYTVDSAQRGIELRFGAYSQTTQPGLHWHLPYPFDTVELVDIDKNRTAKDFLEF